MFKVCFVQELEMWLVDSQRDNNLSVLQSSCYTGRFSELEGLLYDILMQTKLSWSFIIIATKKVPAPQQTKNTQKQKSQYLKTHNPPKNETGVFLIAQSTKEQTTANPFIIKNVYPFPNFEYQTFSELYKEDDICYLNFSIPKLLIWKKTSVNVGK